MCGRGVGGQKAQKIGPRHKRHIGYSIMIALEINGEMVVYNTKSIGQL